jgi:hypothetical protein
MKVIPTKLELVQEGGISLTSKFDLFTDKDDYLGSIAPSVLIMSPTTEKSLSDFLDGLCEDLRKSITSGEANRKVVEETAEKAEEDDPFRS